MKVSCSFSFIWGMAVKLKAFLNHHLLIDMIV